MRLREIAHILEHCQLVAYGSRAHAQAILHLDATTAYRLRCLNILLYHNLQDRAPAFGQYAYSVCHLFLVHLALSGSDC